MPLKMSLVVTSWVQYSSDTFRRLFEAGQMHDYWYCMVIHGVSCKLPSCSLDRAFDLPNIAAAEVRAFMKRIRCCQGWYCGVYLYYSCDWCSTSSYLWCCSCCAWIWVKRSCWRWNQIILEMLNTWWKWYAWINVYEWWSSGETEIFRTSNSRLTVGSIAAMERTIDCFNLSMKQNKLVQKRWVRVAQRATMTVSSNDWVTIWYGVIVFVTLKNYDNAQFIGNSAGLKSILMIQITIEAPNYHKKWKNSK